MEKKKTPNILNTMYQFIIKTMNGMVFGLFATLIIGLIINQIGKLTNYDFNLFNHAWNVGASLMSVATFVQSLMGVGIGVGIGLSLKFDGLKLIGAAIAGGIAASKTLFGVSDPLGTYLVTIFTLLLVDLILKKKTPFDIILIPLLNILLAYVFALILIGPISSVSTIIGQFINRVTEFEQPFLMGILVSVLMGIILTSPLSSAAIAISFQIGGIAGGAAAVGCCANMLGFMVMGRKDNDLGTTISVGLGTSMLQFKNILKKPIIWLPPIIASAILAPFATLLLKTQTSYLGAGMGTAGLVGQFATYDAMGNTLNTWLSIFLLQIIAPIILVYGLDLLFRKLKLYGPGDLKI